MGYIVRMKMNDKQNVNTVNSTETHLQQKPTKQTWPNYNNDIVVFFGVTQDEDERYCDTNIVDGLDIRCRD